MFENAAAKRGHVFCRYPDEQESVGTARLYLGSLPEEYELLASIHALQPNLSIGKVLTAKAIDITMAKIAVCQT